MQRNISVLGLGRLLLFGEGIVVGVNETGGGTGTAGATGKDEGGG